MDFLAVILAISILGHITLGLLAIQVARNAGRHEAHNKMLLAQVEELKGMVAGADFAQMHAMRLMQQAEAEVERAKRLK